MRIAVCIKQILDPETIKVSRSREALDERRAQKIMNPPDRWALDAALRIKETDPSVEVVALSVGDEEAEQVLRHALAMGCDRAILLTDPILVGIRASGLAQALAAAISQVGPVDLVLTGQFSLDTGNGTLALRLAVELGDWPALPAVSELTLADGQAMGRQHIGDRSFSSSYPLPVVASVLDVPAQPRYPHSAHIMNAYRQQAVEVWDCATLGIDLESVPEPTQHRRMRLPPEREFGIRVGEDESPADATQALIATLKSRRII